MQALNHCCHQWTPAALPCCGAARTKSHPAPALLLELLCSSQGSKALLSNHMEAMLRSLVKAISSSTLLQQYWFNTKNPYKFVPVMAFADAFKKYKTGQRNAEALSVPYPAESGHKQALVYNKFALSSECGVQLALLPLAVVLRLVPVQAAGCHLLMAACHMVRVWHIDVHVQHSWQPENRVLASCYVSCSGHFTGTAVLVPASDGATPVVQAGSLSRPC